MSEVLIRNTEPLAPEELLVLTTKADKSRSSYYKAYGILMIFAFVFPFIGAWYRAYEGAPNAFSFTKFFVACGILLFIFTFSTIASFRIVLGGLLRDLKDQTKTVDTHKITRKVHAVQTDTYYFYIDSYIRLSIEVSSEHYFNYKEGDELSIEYATHSHEFLGYF